MVESENQKGGTVKTMWRSIIALAERECHYHCFTIAASVEQLLLNTRAILKGKLG
jgi:hypothetical protein